METKKDYASPKIDVFNGEQLDVICTSANRGWSKDLFNDDNWWNYTAGGMEE